MGSQVDLVVLVATAVLFGVLSGAHTALELLSYRQTDREAEEPVENARFIGQLVSDPFYHYLSVGIGRVVMIALVIVAASRFAAVRLFEGNYFAPGLWLVAVLALLVPLAVAKTIALKDPEKYLDRTKYITYPIVYLMWPAAFLAAAGLRRISPDALERLAIPVMPFKRRIELFGYKNGSDETDEQQLVSSVFDFRDTKVREVMVPRIDMIAVNVHTNRSEAVDLIVEAGHSRVPVFDDTIDRIVGVLHAKDVLGKVVAG
ncbi:MAG: hypothetical protein H6Q78_1614, partial [Candidatus Krumholzibacteriota bacterium]|nr:hypothetical protein [Candidatus Krumholzibacteriota bacterium]